jgi:prevent-host-death family protein
MQINMHEAKSHLSELAKRVHGGERVIVARAGEPYVELVPFQPRGGSRKLGGFEDEIRMAPDFDETPEEIIQSFEGP